MGGGTRGGEMSREEEEAQALVDIWKYVFGYVDMAVVKCAIELGIPDVLESQEDPMTLSELSSTLECSPPALHRVMRFLVHRQIFKEDRTSQGSMGYVQTPLSRLLMKNGEKSMAPLVLLESNPMMLAPWHSLSASVLANSCTSPFESAHGDDIWSIATANPSFSKLINDAMACNAWVAVPAVINEYPKLFDGLNSMVDVGGGDGSTICMLVKACPWIRGINFDLPHVVSEAPECVGVEHVGGDMFESVPKADAAFLKWVLHDWNDDECIRILKKCREAIPKDKGRVIIVEAVIGEEEEEEEKKERDKLEFVRLMMDMVMMAHTNKGKERSSKEWAYVLTQAGFTRHTIKPIKAVQSIIEAYP